MDDVPQADKYVAAMQNTETGANSSAKARFQRRPRPEHLAASATWLSEITVVREWLQSLQVNRLFSDHEQRFGGRVLHL